MKQSFLLLAVLISGAASKNVVNLDDLRGKRDAKNTLNLDKLRLGLADEKDFLKEGEIVERDPKNVINLEDLKHKEKREPKNVINLEDLKHKEKREPKNVINLEDLKHIKGEKREPKNVINLEDLKHVKDTRDAKNVINLEDLKHVKDTRDAKNVANLEYLVYNSKHLSSKREDIVIGNEVLLQSALPTMQSISIMAGYVRTNEDLDRKTESSSNFMVLIAPTNQAISDKLHGKKPWEFPEEPVDDEAAQRNIDSFLAHHVISDLSNASVDSEDNVLKNRLDCGQIVQIRQTGDDIFVRTGADWISVDTVKHVNNGMVLVINDVLTGPKEN